MGYFSKVNTIVLLAFIYMTPATADKTDETIVWFGDSLCAPHYSLAEQIDDFEIADVKNVCRGGMKLRDFVVPPWLNCNAYQGRRIAALWAGSNDAIWLYHSVEPHQVETALVAAIADFEAANCPLTVIRPPQPPLGHAWYDNFADVRAIFDAVAADHPSVDWVELSFNWDQTIDGVHQTKMQHFWQGAAMAQHWDLTPPPVPTPNPLYMQN